jgi:hypothetical protein
MKNFYDFYKLLSESFQQNDEFLSFILNAVEKKKEELGNDSYMDAITKLNREIREPLTNFTVNDYGDLIRFLYFVYGDMVKGEDDSRFRRQVTCIGYFFSLAVTDDVLQKSDIVRVIVINNCANPSMPDFIKDFKQFASSHGYNFGSNWINLYRSLASRSEIIFDGFTNLLTDNNMEQYARFLIDQASASVELPDNHRILHRATRENPKRKHWTKKVSRYMNPEFVKLIVPLIPENLFSLQQVQMAGSGIALGPHGPAYDNDDFSEEQHGSIKQQMLKYDNVKFGENPARDEMVILDLAAHILDETDNTELFDGGENSIGVSSIIKKLFFEITDDQEEEAIRTQKLPLSRTEIAVLNFFFKGLRNAVVEKVFPLSLALTLYLIDVKAGSRKKLGRMEFELAQAIKARKERLGIDDSEDHDLDFEFYQHMAALMLESKTFPYFTVRGVIEQIRHHEMMTKFLKKLVNELKKEYGLSGF